MSCARARTRIGRSPGGLILARAVVRPNAQTVEPLAHELEHVVEYLEGVGLLMEAQRGNSRVSLSGGAYETRCTIDAGRRVARVVRDATAGRGVTGGVLSHSRGSPASIQ